LENLRSLENTLTEIFEETRRDIEVNQRLRKNLHPKTGNYEFIRALHKYISYKFPKMKEADKAALIGAVKTGAGLLPSAMPDGDPIESVQTEMKRAKRHEKKQRKNDVVAGKLNRHAERLQSKKKQTAKRSKRK
jgi:hypothetical protein